MSKISWLIPALDINGSGGFKTLIDKINYLAQFYPTNLYIGKVCNNKEIKNINDIVQKIEHHYGKFHNNINPVLGYDNINDDSDLQIATVYYTAKWVKQSIVPLKAYFVQDLEYMFFPMCSSYIEAENSYQLGLKHITIGKWLCNKLKTDYEANCMPITFGVDNNVYFKNDSILKENAICCLLQPDKDRRLHELLIRSIKIIKEKMPEIDIYFYGSKLNEEYFLKLPKDTYNLRLLSNKQLNNLYNKCLLGVCFSPTNPSRIPFEMMNCGLPCVDIMYDGNKLYDYYNGYEDLCAQSTPISVADRIINLLNNKKELEKHSKQGLDFIKNKDYNLENKQFKKHVDKILKGHWI